MVRRIALAWVLAILAATSASAQIPISRDLVPKRSAMARLGLEQNWMALVPIVGSERLTSISLAENLLFAQTNQANFYAFDAESGRMLWTANLGHETGSAQPASVNSRLVFVTNSNNLFALERHTGRVVWVQNLGTLPTSPTACDEHNVMVGLSNGKLTAFSLYNSNDKKKALYAVPRASWNWQTGGGALTSRPLPAQQFVAFGGRDGKLYVALSELPEDQVPVLLYRIATGGEIFAPLGAYGTRTILVPSADKNVYAVDLFTASVKWTYPSGAPVMQMPLAADHDVYSVNLAGLLTSLDAETGERHWMTSTHGGRLISISAKKLYLESHDDDLFIVDRGTGQILADPRATYQRAGLNLRDYDLSLTNDLNDRLYMATRSGMVISLREIGQTQPRPLRDPKLPPFGFIPPEGALTVPTPTLVVPETPAENAVPAPGAAAPGTP
jgi:outer membrane protein assembly factor BamB